MAVKGPAGSLVYSQMSQITKQPTEMAPATSKSPRAGGASAIGTGGLVTAGMKVIKGNKYATQSSHQVDGEDVGVGISKAIGPESSFHSEISKSGLTMIPPSNTMQFGPVNQNN